MILAVENGCFGYKNNKNILNNINFSVSGGDVLAVLGPNGAGKTTLLRCIMGFLNWSSGKSILNGEDIRKIPAKRLWSNIAYVPQAKPAVCSYTAAEMILLGRGSKLGIFESPKEKDVMAAERIMSDLGIVHLKDKKCSEMSGGELQMVLIARALAAEPKVLILDEPESNLDFKNQLLVLDTISRLAKEGMTCIFNTHYPAHALQRASKSLILDKQGNSLFGETHNVVTESNIEAAFGVRAVIGEVETDMNILRDIIPLEITGADKNMAENRDDTEQLAVISIAADRDSAEGINKILHDYREYVVGRMGMPYNKYGVNVINLILDGPACELRKITARLTSQKGVGVKTVYVKKDSINDKS